jgi:hypothetical protein
MTLPKRFEYSGELIRGPHGGYFIDFPFDVMKEFGTRKTVKIKIWYDGHLERKSLLPKGNGKHWVSISYALRTRLGKSDGDQLQIVVEPDLDPRTVDIPEDFEWLLDNEPDLKEIFFRQSFFNQKFFTEWIQQSLAPDVRVNRISRILEWLIQHKKGKAPGLPGKENTLSDT